MIIAVLLFLATASVFRVAVVMLAVPFSLVGAVWLLWLLGYHLSGAVWVGMIALAGLDAETGLVMLLFLDNSYERAKSQEKMNGKEDLLHAVHDGAVKRIRPKTMTVAAAFCGLVPLLWASRHRRRRDAPTGGADARRIVHELPYGIADLSGHLLYSEGSCDGNRKAQMSKYVALLANAAEMASAIRRLVSRDPRRRRLV